MENKKEEMNLGQWKFLAAMSREFGQGLILLLVGVVALSYALNGIYSDFKSGNAVIIELVRAQATNETKLTIALSELSLQVANNTKAIETLVELKNENFQR